LLQIARVTQWTWVCLGRRQKAVLIVLVGLCGLFFLGTAIWEGLPQSPTAFESSPEVKILVEGNNAFAMDMYHALQEKPGNLFFSPFSISSSLAMTSAGARGQTEAEMTNVLHFKLSHEELHAAFKSLNERMNRLPRWNRIVLNCANSLWCQKDYGFQPGFMRIVQQSYFADARLVDFKDSAQAAGEINRWITKKTKNRIPVGLTPGQLGPDTRMALCDAIYFKGKWQYQFKVRDTRPAEFHVTTNETVTVPMMSRKAEFKMARTDDYLAELLEMPYVGGDLSMIIVLPTVGYEFPDMDQPGLPNLEKNLTAENLQGWLAALDRARPHETWVSVPRFTTALSFDLVNELKSLGMVSPFDEKADFSGLDGTTNLFLSEVIHKTFVDVNESGTEATAVSISLVRSKSAADSFVVNRPFLFLIRENASGSILFLGRIINPTQ
jgi:serpin B